MAATLINVKGDAIKALQFIDGYKAKRPDDPRAKHAANAIRNAMDGLARAHAQLLE